MKHSLFAEQAGHHHLRRLIALRGVAVAAQCLVLGLAYYALDMRLPWFALLATVTALFVFNLLSWWRLSLDYPVTNPELFVQLFADVLALAVLLYFSGGSTNPFISMFLLPLVITAAALPRSYTWGMAALTTLCYTLLMKYYVPLPHHMPNGMNHGMSAMEGMDMNSMMPQENIFNLHIFGMWLGFVLSAAIIAFFVVRMAQAVRERDETLARAREEILRNERIVSLGTLAAGAAHELGTPLSTMSVVIGELQHEANLNADWKNSLELLNSQIRNCRRILDKMLDDSQPAAQPLGEFLAATLEEWRLLRPATECAYKSQDCDKAMLQSFDPSLRPALLNLLNNAADASPQQIEVEARCSEDQLTLTISDHGPGLTAETAARAGSAFFTTKQEGRGLGLFLANATLERMGGRVRLFNREGGGASTEVTLPLKATA